VPSAARPGGPILVTGGNGQIGYELVRELESLGGVIAPPREALDLGKPVAIREAVQRLRPRVIINAAAYTAVDAAETDREECAAINARAPGVLAEEARRVGAVLVHYSTDYVFDGRKRTPYVETDPTGPLSYYGETKLEGERAVQSVGGAYVILRTSWVYGTRGKNFFRTILRLARERVTLAVVNDQVGAPTWSRAVATATADLVRAFSGHSGIFHLTAAGNTTWYEFAQCILDGDPRREEQIHEVITPISSEEFEARAKRPPYSILDCTACRDTFGIALPDWREQLALVLSELRTAAPR
jgi:dTDP-4-dehydrorhamnose reductase